jgi:hypothetical protein
VKESLLSNCCFLTGCAGREVLRRWCRYLIKREREKMHCKDSMKAHHRCEEVRLVIILR